MDLEISWGSGETAGGGREVRDCSEPLREVLGGCLTSNSTGKGASLKQFPIAYMESSLLHLLEGLNTDPRTESSLLLCDREALPFSGQSSHLRLSHLEARIRECSAMLRAKERELELARAIQRMPGVRADISQMQEMQGKFARLEDENRRLKALMPLKAEADRLRRELDQANTLKSAYEERYNEVAVRLAGLDQSEDSSVLIDDSEKRSDLAKKVELFKHANADLVTHIAETAAALEAIQKERDSLRDDLIPQLQVTMRELEDRGLGLETELTTARQSKEHSPKPSTEVMPVAPSPALRTPCSIRIQPFPFAFASDTKRSSTRQSTVIRRSVPGPHLEAQRKGVRTQGKVITSRPANMRKQVTPLPVRHQEGYDQFADSFPDEDEQAL